MGNEKKNSTGKSKKNSTKKSKKSEGKIKVSKDGPYIVSCKIPLSKEIIIADSEGSSYGWKKEETYSIAETYSLCRCGKSGDKPFCDNAHKRTNFKGTETARKEKYLNRAEVIDGPGIKLTDVENLCAVARFCHLGGGTWDLTEKSDDPKAKELAIKEACNCPSGRLVVWDKKTNKPMETKFEPSIVLLEDPSEGVSGPIWVRGEIRIESADGKEYEVRNRVTLCRCGKSKNKPFCDGTHISAKFNDGDKSLR